MIKNEDTYTDPIYSDDIESSLWLMIPVLILFVIGGFPLYIFNNKRNNLFKQKIKQ